MRHTTRLDGAMRNSTWKITTLKDGEAVASVEGVSHENAVAAVQNAMYGRDPLAGVTQGDVAQEQAETLAAAA
jgi:aerobic-type carbon monoxide dehydrogenase small subunit (CoxS/CutS family)